MAYEFGDSISVTEAPTGGSALVIAVFRDDATCEGTHLDGWIAAPVTDETSGFEAVGATIVAPAGSGSLAIAVLCRHRSDGAASTRGLTGLARRVFWRAAAASWRILPAVVQNRIVARFADGRVLKGTTADFLPSKPVFHLVPTPQSGTSIAVVEVKVAELKALFFVKDFAGNPDYNESKEFAPGKPVQGRRLEVVFKDGETLVGTTTGYQPDRAGFFLVPADPNSNNDRCFIVADAVKAVRFL